MQASSGCSTFRKVDKIESIKEEADDILDATTVAESGSSLGGGLVKLGSEGPPPEIFLNSGFERQFFGDN